MRVYSGHGSASRRHHSNHRGISRRTLLFVSAATLLSACQNAFRSPTVAGRTEVGNQFDPDRAYAATTDNGINLPAVNLSKLQPDMYRRRVKAPIDAPRGTILVRLAECHLYMFTGNQEAIRYGVGIGKEGYSWKGGGTINRIRSWPRWTPPPEMIRRTPELADYSEGMDGGISNPLGARALYIFSGGNDTLYRIHGTPEWWSIGSAASSGCIRMINQDVIDLASRAVSGAPVLIT